MPIKSFRPVTPTRRFQTYLTREDITKDKPEKSLVEGKKRTGGRDARGLISSRFRGGGAKKAYRIIDFKRDKFGVSAKVAVALLPLTVQVGFIALIADSRVSFGNRNHHQFWNAWFGLPWPPTVNSALAGRLVGMLGMLLKLKVAFSFLIVKPSARASPIVRAQNADAIVTAITVTERLVNL